MQVCDIYLPYPIKSRSLKFLNLYDKNFVYDENIYYSGYLNVNILRIKNITFVMRLRDEGLVSYNVPIRYRDEETMNPDDAYLLAKKYANRIGGILSKDYRRGLPPLWWVFGLDLGDDRAGGHVHVDRIDGRIWESWELEMYMYDYNNML